MLQTLETWLRVAICDQLGHPRVGTLMCAVSHNSILLQGSGAAIKALIGNVDCGSGLKLRIGSIENGLCLFGLVVAIRRDDTEIRLEARVSRRQIATIRAACGVADEAMEAAAI